MGERTWPRSPHRGGFSSLGECTGSREGVWKTQNVERDTSTPSQSCSGEVGWDGDGIHSLFSGGLPLLVLAGHECVTRCCPLLSPALARWLPAHRQLLLAGQMLGPRADRTPPPRHEDGTVRFWDASGVSLKPLYKLGTANIFQTDCEHNDSLNQAGEEEWPPFRKVRSPGQGDTTMDLSTLPALPALEGANPELGTGDAPAGAIPAAPRGRVPRLRAQLLCDALWGHKGRLFRGPHPVGLPQHGGESQGVCGDRLLLGVMPRVCRVPQLVEGCGGAGGAAPQLCAGSWLSLQLSPPAGGLL